MATFRERIASLPDSDWRVCVARTARCVPSIAGSALTEVHDGSNIEGAGYDSSELAGWLQPFDPFAQGSLT